MCQIFRRVATPVDGLIIGLYLTLPVDVAHHLPASLDARQVGFASRSVLVKKQT